MMSAMAKLAGIVVMCGALIVVVGVTAYLAAGITGIVAMRQLPEYNERRDE